MNKKGFMIPIPQMIAGIISMFIAILGVRIVMPMVQPILNLAWHSQMAKAAATIVVYLVIACVVYIIVYGTILGKTPNIMGMKRESEGGYL